MADENRLKHERSVFLKVLAEDSPQAREHKISELCGGDIPLRNRIVALLRSYDHAITFLEHPPSPQLEELRGLSSGSVTSNSHLRASDQLGDSTVHQPTQGQETTDRPWPTVMDRYQIEGEVARGGMGAVLRARDMYLGRELAIKVLLDCHRDRPEIVHRFIEEGQIGGQLQHPGIPPIFELGVFSDGRPFISMKLVKGETLSKLLAARNDPSEDLDRFISVFEQICQTMAYVHQRGVIHRDLKPNNVMVGAFREVQVMDWGLAKVLVEKSPAHLDSPAEQPASVIRTVRNAGSDTPFDSGLDNELHTRAGSVLGTLAYMPPEQALGNIEQLDERADVFALGAILCEVLTGKPPYVKNDTTNIHLLAVRGQLSECLERLDNCGADAILVDLARECLELEPQDRPGNASQVAERVTDYIETVRKKLRDAELQLAAEEARTIEQRKRRRVSYVLTATILAFATSAAVVWREVSRNIEIVRARAAATGLIDNLLSADVRQLPNAMDAIQPIRSQISNELQARWRQAPDGSSDKLRLSVALMTGGSSDKSRYLLDQLPYLNFDEFVLVRQALNKLSIQPPTESLQNYWSLALSPDTSQTTVFQVGCVLASYDPQDTRWQQLAPLLVKLLVNDDTTVPSLQLTQRVEQLHLVAPAIEPDLRSVLESADASEFARQRSATGLASLWSNAPEKLVDTILTCRRQSEFAPLVAALDTQSAAAIAAFDKFTTLTSQPLYPRDQATKVHHQWCIAVICLAHLGQCNRAVDLLVSTDMPTVGKTSLLSLLKHYAQEIQIDAAPIADLLKHDRSLNDDSRRELVDFVGRWGPGNLAKSAVREIELTLEELARDSSDPGVHWTTQSTLSRIGSKVRLESLPQSILDDSIAQQVRKIKHDSQAIAAELEDARVDLPQRRLAWENQLVQRNADDFKVDNSTLKFKLSLDGPEAFELLSDLQGGARESAERQLRNARRVGSIRNLAIEFLGHPPIDLGDAYTFRHDQPFSMGAWLYVDPNQTRQWCSVLSRMNPGEGNQGVDLWLDGAKIGVHLTHREPDSFIKVLTMTEQPRRYWHHLFVSYDGRSSAQGVRIYIDGRSVPTSIVSDTLRGSIETQAPLMLGSRGDGSFPFRGWIEEIQIFAKELSPAEIESIYLSTIHMIAKMRRPLKPERRYPLEQAFQDEAAVALEEKQRVLLERMAELSWTNRRRWFSNSQQQAFSILANEVAVSGSDSQRYDFAIGIHEVTQNEFRQFRPREVQPGSAGNAAINGEEGRTPVGNLNWYDAAAYCNWLSAQEGIAADQWCFEPNEAGQMAAGAKLKSNYLQLAGYRLPTVIEWRAACRYHAAAAYTFAESAELIDDYGWYARNARGQVHPVGTLAGNPLGLFDVHGNVSEWTMDLSNLGPDDQITASSKAVWVGGNVLSPLNAMTIDSTSTAALEPAGPHSGFRLTKTILPP